MRGLHLVARHFEHTLGVDRPPSDLSAATPSTLPATQWQRSKDRAIASENRSGMNLSTAS